MPWHPSLSRMLLPQTDGEACLDLFRLQGRCSSVEQINALSLLVLFQFSIHPY